MNEVRLVSENTNIEHTPEDDVETRNVPDDRGASEEILKPIEEDTDEFEEAIIRALKEVTQKYAWTAQQRGIVLRRNPLKLAPMDDYVFNRVSRAQYGFRYINRAQAAGHLVSERRARDGGA